MLDEWMETTNGNRVSRRARISGASAIAIHDNTTICEEAVLCGDVKLALDEAGTAINIGKYCFLGTGCRVEPPVLKKTDSETLHGPLRIGAYTTIGANSEVRLATIGSRVTIGEDCRVGNLSIIYDCCVVENGAVVPPKQVVPPFSLVTGVPGKNFAIRGLHGGYRRWNESRARERYILGE